MSFMIVQTFDEDHIRFLRVEFDTLLQDQLRQMRAIMQTAPEGLGLHRFSALVVGEASLVTVSGGWDRYDTERDPVIEGLLDAEEQHPIYRDNGFMILNDYPDPERLYDVGGSVYVHLYRSGDVAFSAYWGDGEVESWVVPLRVFLGNGVES